MAECRSPGCVCGEFGFPHVIVPKGPGNPHGSTTGPHDRIGGWGKPAAGESCPKCGSKSFRYVPGFAEAASNDCSDCGYSEAFLY